MRIPLRFISRYGSRSKSLRQLNGNLITTIFSKGKLSRLDNLKSRGRRKRRRRHLGGEGGISDEDAALGDEKDGKRGENRTPDEEENDMGALV
ncbi:hypothetical protein Trydic_g16999 [Trypoxylus dichotomus]